MQTRVYVAAILTAIVCQFTAVHKAYGLGMEAFGPAEHVGASSSWPKGVAQLQKHESRVYWRDVNGYGISFYKSDIEKTNELIELFSKLDVKRHIVILRIGPGETKTFGGKPIPYSVMFDMPAGMFLHHAKQYTETGVYSTEPSLVIQVDESWAKQLGKLKFPASVEIFRSQYPHDRLMEAADSPDRNTRCRALEFLGEVGIDSAETRKLLVASSKELDQYIRRNATNAIAKLDALAKLDAQFRDSFDKFVEDHPRRHRAPTPEEVLKKIKDTDKAYATDGFTVRGTLVNMEGNVMKWVATMGNDRLVLHQTAIDDKAVGRIEHTIFVSPNDMVTIQREQFWSDGKLIQSKPFKSVEPVGNTYDLLIGRVLWPTGRSYSRRIDQVESVKENFDGTLDVVASSGDGLRYRWELTVDPFSGYLVRAAKATRPRDNSTEYVLSAAGVFSSEERSANHTAHWREGENAEPISYAVNEVSAKPDLNLIIDLEERIAKGE